MNPDSIATENPGVEREIARYFERLWPIMRSITGDGVRQTHDILAELVPLERIEVPTGTQVFDWTVPQEWVFRSAHIIDPNNKKILDAKENNLHLVNYSVPFSGRLTREELDAHLYSLPDLPEAIPYVTSYYKPRWGFCLPHKDRENLPEGSYEVLVDTDLVSGSLTISEAVLPGSESTEVLFSTYTCHPSMANNELSGPLIAAFLYRKLAALPNRRLTYRFVFLPETIGSITYLHLRGDHLKEKMSAGYVVTCGGDAGPYTYKRSRQRESLADRAAELALRQAGVAHKIVDFFPLGSDERQYCSPGFNLPVGSLMRSMYTTYKEYHTSLDNRDFISFKEMENTVDLYLNIVKILEVNRTYKSNFMYCEPQLGKRGLYPSLGAPKEIEKATEAMMWLLNLSDGEHDLIDISNISNINIFLLGEAAKKCLANGIISFAEFSSQPN